MARKVTCPHCNAQTYDTPSCGRCGGALPRQQSVDTLSPEEKKVKEQKDIADKLVFRISMVRRAAQADEELKKITLARVQAHQESDGVTFAKTNLVVERERHQYVYTAVGRQPVKLDEGQYSLGKIMLAGGGKTEEFGALVCEVSETPIPVTFVFPDYQSINSSLYNDPTDEEALKGINEALNSLSLRTSDDRLGGAILQIRLRCIDPIRLIRCKDASQADLSVTELTRKGIKDKKVPIPDERWFWQRWWDNVRDVQPDTTKIVRRETLQTQQISMADVYRMIRLELAEAIGNAVRDFSVEALYDKQDSNRARLHGNLKTYMEKTLESYGLQIVDVVAFQFRSPDYEEFLQRRGDNALRKKDLDNDRLAAENRRVKRELDFQEFEHVETIEERQDHMELERKERLHAREKQLALEQQAREIALERQQHDWQHEKALKGIELQSKLQEQQFKVLQSMQDADHQRRIEAVKLIASFPPEQQFLLAMQYNPELQKAFVAMQTAKSQQSQLEMAKDFEVRVQKIYGQQSDQTNALLLEAAKQLGLVAAAKATGPKQPSVIVHEVAPAPNADQAQ